MFWYNNKWYTTGDNTWGYNISQKPTCVMFGKTECHTPPVNGKDKF